MLFRSSDMEVDEDELPWSSEDDATLQAFPASAFQIVEGEPSPVGTEFPFRTNVELCARWNLLNHSALFSFHLLRFSTYLA